MTATSAAKVYLICGFIGAGKTTFAKRLEAETGAVRITKDEWSIRFIGNDPTIDGYAEHDQKVIDLSRAFAFQLAGKGVDVIVDEGFWAREEREELRRRFEELGARVVFYWVDTPLDVIRERVRHRNTEPGGDSFVISPELLEFYLPLWQPPGDDEDVVRVGEMRR